MNHSLTNKAKTALSELIDDLDPESGTLILDELFECWLLSNSLNCSEVEYRAERLHVYKTLRKFLTNVGE